jgi:hypothetical protein
VSLWKIVAALIALCMAFVGGCRYESNARDAQEAQERTRQALAQMNAVDRARAEEQRRIQTLSEIANDATKQADRARADARAAGAAAERLRQRVATLLRDASNPAPTGAGSAEPGPAVVLAELFTWADRRAGELAEALDAARIAGQTCERAYGSLAIPK